MAPGEPLGWALQGVMGSFIDRTLRSGSCLRQLSVSTPGGGRTPSHLAERLGTTVNGRSNRKAVASKGPSRGRAARPALGAFPLLSSVRQRPVLSPSPLLGLGVTAGA